ncbi:MAG: hypothetical protein OEY85_09990 [Rhodospirillales bacterium]|nr:hypothetical protein [Rhodospirillales bacterium]
MTEKPESGTGGAHVMTLDRLRAILDAYGAERDRWPVAERRAMQHLLAERKDARDLFGEAREFDRLLDQVEAPAPSAGLTDRALNLPGEIKAEASPKPGDGGMGSWFPQSVIRPQMRFAALLAAGIVGFVIGVSLPGAEAPLPVPAAAQVVTGPDGQFDFQDETPLLGLIWPVPETGNPGLDPESGIDAYGTEEFDSASLI